jgi:hypothetical protein
VTALASALAWLVVLRGGAGVGGVVLVLLQAVLDEFHDARPVANRVVIVAVREHIKAFDNLGL